MKYNRNLIIYLENWAVLNELKCTTTHEYFSHGPVKRTTVNFYKLTDTRYEAPIFALPINWDLLDVLSPIEVGDYIIREVKQRLNNQGATDDVEQLYPKTLTADEHKAYMRHIKTKINSIYGAGNFCYGMTGGYTLPPRHAKAWKNLYGSKGVAALFPKIEDVIFNDPATIVFWKDGTKTSAWYDEVEDITKCTCPVCGAIRYDEGKTCEDRGYYCKHTHIKCEPKKSDNE